MGAGYCQWDGLTDRNIYNIYGDAHLAYTEIQAPRSIGCSRRACDRRKEGKLGNIYRLFSYKIFPVKLQCTEWYC